MAGGTLGRRVGLGVLIAFVVFCAIGMAYLPFVDLYAMGHVTYFYLMLAVAGLVGAGGLVRTAGVREPSAARSIARWVIAYLLFDLLVVVPVAVGMEVMTLNTIIGEVAVRFSWLLFPIALAVVADERGKRTLGAVAAAAAVGLAIWALISAATGGGGYYVEEGVSRWRALSLGGGGLLLFAWPFVLVASRAVPRRFAAVLLVASLVGLVLTNSRSGIIAFALAGLVCVAISGQARRLIPWILPTILLGAIAALVWGEKVSGAFSYTLAHLFDVSTGNGADRLARWGLAWDFFVARPFNDYAWSWRYYLVYVYDLYQPHNFFFEIAVTEGIAGLVFYGAVLWDALKGAWTWARKDAEVRALFGYLTIYLVFSFQNANWYLPVAFPLLVIAIAALVSRLDRLRSDGGPAPVHALDEPATLLS